ncbi:MAG: RNA polymerase sigma factor [Candidatus Lernaella stagnicola]|nr:RNA polymerase sigma factor [Candidatus Lernaella stagnicola]
MGCVKNQQSREAFSVLMSRHKNHAYRLALQLTGDHDDAMDGAQEAFVKVFTKARLFDEGRRFWPWFATILRNTVRSMQRSRARRRRAGNEELAQHIADPTADTTVRARAAEAWGRVLALPPKLREVVVLRHLEGMSYEDIGAVLDISPNTVATRLHAARKKLAGDDEA